MQVTVESTGTLERRMRVELPAERIEQEVNSRLKSVGRTAKLKGFRPGKVPAKVVKQRYGKQIRQEVESELVQKSYSDAVMQENLIPAGGPRIEPEISKDKNSFAYVATFEVMPKVELDDLDKLKVEVPDVSIDDSDLDAMILKLQKQKAHWETVERKSAQGDRVVVDFTGTLNGEVFPGGTGTEVPVVLGEGQMLQDFEKALFGIKAGDEKSFKVKFPKDYHTDDLAGKKVEFAIKTHRVEEQILPPVDDALAEAFEVKEGGIERFKTDVRDNMTREADAKAKNDVREQIMAALLEANPIEVPNTLKHQEMHTLQHDAMRRMGIEDHDQAPAIENFEEMGEKRVRLSLLISQLIADQNLTVDDDKVRARVEEMCAGYENAEDMVNMYLANPQIVQQIQPMVLEQQAIDWLLENGKSSKKKVSFTEYMNP
ncbi:MAG: trigger factor [Gammaproteobacteria bacterium]|nr:trigger factor [Gammaproteobacteria bacterium]